MACVIFVLCSSENKTHDQSDISQPEIHRGNLDLSNWNFANDGSITLEGEWEFYWIRF